MKIDLGELVEANNPASPAFYLANIGTPGWYTLETYGPANIVTGLWGPFLKADDAIDQAPFGRALLEGVGCWNCQQLAAGFYLIRITQQTPGAFSFKLRNWQFGDEAQVQVRGL